MLTLVMGLWFFFIHWIQIKYMLDFMDWIWWLTTDFRLLLKRWSLNILRFFCVSYYFIYVSIVHRNDAHAVWCTDRRACTHKGEHRKAHASISNHHGNACEHVLTRGHTHVHSFTLCLCGLGEPAKLSFLLLSEVSQSDPLALPTCSSHSQTAEAAVSQYKAEGGEKERRKVRQEKAAVQTTVQTRLLHPGRLPKTKILC